MSRATRAHLFSCSSSAITPSELPIITGSLCNRLPSGSYAISIYATIIEITITGHNNGKWCSSLPSDFYQRLRFEIRASHLFTLTSTTMIEQVASLSQKVLRAISISDNTATAKLRTEESRRTTRYKLWTTVRIDEDFTVSYLRRRYNSSLHDMTRSFVSRWAHARRQCAVGAPAEILSLALENSCVAFPGRLFPRSLVLLYY